jgi:hypothetical protein
MNVFSPYRVYKTLLLGIMTFFIAGFFLLTFCAVNTQTTSGKDNLKQGCEQAT